MFGMDSYWVVSEALLVITFIAYIITQVLMPSRKKVEEGNVEVPIWIAFILGIMIIGTIGVVVFAFMFVEKNMVIMISGGVLILALILGFADFILTKRKADELAMTEGDLHHAVEISPDGLAHYEHPHLQHHYHNHQHIGTQGHQIAPAPGTMTVECPQCGSHIHMIEGSHQITCPYCGLSGTI